MHTRAVPRAARWQMRTRLTLRRSLSPPPGLPGSTLPALPHRVGSAALGFPLAAAGSPRCHWVNGIIYLFMSPDVSSPSTARRRRWRAGLQSALLGALERPGRWEGGAGEEAGREWWRNPGVSTIGFVGDKPPPRDSRKTEHAPSVNAVDTLWLGSLHHRF